MYTGTHFFFTYRQEIRNTEDLVKSLIIKTLNLMTEIIEDSKQTKFTFVVHFLD